jgi:hypothetical protein
MGTNTRVPRDVWLNKRPIDRQRPTASYQNDSWTSFPGAVKVQLAATDVD